MEDLTVEDVEAFRLRAREWISANLPLERLDKQGQMYLASLTEEQELAAIQAERALQRRFYDGGFAGICFPEEYGGLGLTPAHQHAFNEELVGHEFAARIQVPTFTPCAAVILEFGTEEQKRTHLPAILRGEEIWMQFLSEPSGGSDLAGALTTATRDGDTWVLNGSKVWTTGAWWSDWGLCLARTNWDVPKHRGLTVFMVPINHPGVEVQRIEMLSGSREFCQEFLTDVTIPDSYRVGEVDDGWTVTIRWLFHERMLYSSPFVTVPTGAMHGRVGAHSLLGIAQAAGRDGDPHIQDIVGEAHVLTMVSEALQRRISRGIQSGKMSDQSAAIARLFHGTSTVRNATIAFELAGGVAAAWSDDDGPINRCGIDFLTRQTSCIGGGTTEMARNVISERVLGMPRERTLDRDVAFRDVPRNRSTRD